MKGELLLWLSPVGGAGALGGCAPACLAAVPCGGGPSAACEEGVYRARARGVTHRMAGCRGAQLLFESQRYMTI